MLDLCQRKWSDAMRGLDAPGERAERGMTLCRERERAGHVSLLASGFCIAIKRTDEGQQQNVAFYVAGDILDHESFTLGTTTVTIVALTSVVFHRVPHARLQALLDEDDRFATGFWQHVAFQGVLAQEWILSMGRRPAFQRAAHLLCELVSRMGQADGATHRCDFPFTQSELADVLGLSVVHINRTLQRLRHEGYISVRRGSLEVLKWPELKALAAFDPFYLTMAGEGD